MENNKKSSGRSFSAFVIILILAVIGVVVFLLSAVVTYPNEYSVITQFGEIIRIENESGLSSKVPVVQQVKKINKSLQFYDMAVSDVITKDKKTMVVDAYVLWRVTDPTKYLRQLGGNTATAEARLNTVVFNALKTTISGMTQDEVILSRDGKIDVSNLDVDVLTDDIVLEDDSGVVEIQSLTDEIALNLADCSDYGIEIYVAQVKVLDLPQGNKEAVFTRMVSERENVAAGLEAQGDSEAQIIMNTTDREISVMKSEANAEAERIKAEGESEYMKILADAYNSPEKAEFYAFVRALDAAKGSLKDGTLILDESSPLAEIFYSK